MSTEKENGNATDDEFMTRDEILNTVDADYRDVSVPEWGKKADGSPKKVRVRGLTATERDAFEASMVVGSGKNIKVSTLDIRAKLVSLSVVNGSGVPQFNLNDVVLLGKKSAAAMDRIYDAAAKLSKITEEDVEELAKNSGLAPDVNSSSV